MKAILGKMMFGFLDAWRLAVGRLIDAIVAPSK